MRYFFGIMTHSYFLWRETKELGLYYERKDEQVSKNTACVQFGNYAVNHHDAFGHFVCSRNRNN